MDMLGIGNLLVTTSFWKTILEWFVGYHTLYRGSKVDTFPSRPYPTQDVQEKYANAGCSSTRNSRFAEEISK